jgi:putative SOS response-associated peptidase YedK
MCGRYYSLFDKQQVAERFHVRRTADNVGIIAPNYNVAPGDPQPVIRRSRDTGERELVMMRWGIVPWFAKSELEFKKLSTINAKSDRLTDSKMWREPFAKRRCLVPASGLYEWPKPGHAISDTYSEEETGAPADCTEPLAVSGDLFGSAPKPARKAKTAKPIKRVFNITLTEPGPFAFAGIWDAWKRRDGTYLETFPLITTEPNELVAQIHDRLALILHPRDYDRWLGIDDNGGDPRPPLDLLRPYDADKMVMKPANPAVGNWRNNGPEMLDPT